MRRLAERVRSIVSLNVRLSGKPRFDGKFDLTQREIIPLETANGDWPSQ
jgi:hypothetical protein